MTFETITFYIENIPDTPLGPLALASTDAGLAVLEIGIADLDRWARVKGFPAGSVRFGPGPFPAAAQLAAYFAGALQTFDLPLDLRSIRDFQRRVLAAVRMIPYGETRTYAGIAAEIYGERSRTIGQPGAARAVGRANAANPLPIVIPCHRLIGSDGSLRGYGAPGGIRTKARLLAFEKAGGWEV